MSARIIEGDARDIPELDSRSVELVVTSPPYPMIPQWDDLFRQLGASEYSAMHGVLGAAWRECRRVLVPGGILAIVVGDALRSVGREFRLWPNHATIMSACDALGFRPLPYILWKKPTNKPNAFLGSGFLPPNAYVTLDCEFILLFRNGELRRYPPNHPARRSSQYTKTERDRWFSQVWSGVRGVRQSTARGRTAAFPAEIPERLVRMFSCVGETVLDPFAGTGTTLWAALKWGRNAVGVELDPALATTLRERAGGTTDRPPPISPPRSDGGRPLPRPRGAGR